MHNHGRIEHRCGSKLTLSIFGCASEIKINADLFYISLALHENSSLFSLLLNSRICLPQKPCLSYLLGCQPCFCRICWGC